MKRVAITCAILATLAIVFLAINGVESHGPHSNPWEAEIIMLSSAIESYRTDHGHYPTDPGTTEQLKTNTVYDPAAYEAASAFLYRALWNVNEKDTAKPNSSRYFPDFPVKWLRTNKNGVTYIVDPSGNSLGYSTFKTVHPDSPDGNNPTFDLWSTAGNKKQVDQTKWAKSW